mmetsp:Transcript_33610/g.77543  ORF Transcript_33610/g.77543 Transcript_33610/m.77543 type:complete len:467 (-) Transcript_33610:101-1501(-)
MAARKTEVAEMIAAAEKGLEEEKEEKVAEMIVAAEKVVKEEKEEKLRRLPKEKKPNKMEITIVTKNTTSILISPVATPELVANGDCPPPTNDDDEVTEIHGRQFLLSTLPKKITENSLLRILPPPPSRPSPASDKISFSTVDMYEFPHTMSEAVVPGDGSYPLGLENRRHVRQGTTDLDTFERRRHVELVKRWLDVGCQKDGTNKNSLLEVSKENIVVETRQFDYKRGERNPMFRSRSESQRIVLLKDAVDPNHHHKESPSSSASGKKNYHHRYQTRRDHKNRKCTLSVSEVNNIQDASSPAALLLDLQSTAVRIQRDLVRLREQRAAVGCSCHKAKHLSKQLNRYSEKRLREELKKRGLLHEGKNGGRTEKTKMVERLRNAVELEPCCGRDCPCVQSGVDCHSEACSCWRAISRQCGSRAKRYTRQECQKTCGNNLYFYDHDEVSNYRKNLIAQTVPQQMHICTK